MKRKLCILLSLFLLLPTMAMSACNQENSEAYSSESRVESSTENSTESSVATADFSCSVIRTTGNFIAIEIEKASGEETLLDAMDFLQEKAELTYTIENGMVASINGRANATDFSSCWMLYTTDAEMSNTAWGKTKYEDKTLGSAILGAESLVVVGGELYVWAYTTF